MIKRSDTLTHEIREHMKNGEGQVELTSFATKEELLNKARLFANMHLEPHCEIGRHTHENETEIFYITNGEGLYFDNGEETLVKTGDITICNHGEAHGIKALDKPCDFIALIVLS